MLSRARIDRLEARLAQRGRNRDNTDYGKLSGQEFAAAIEAADPAERLGYLRWLAEQNRRIEDGFDLSKLSRDEKYCLERALDPNHVPKHGQDEDLFPDCTCANCVYERQRKARERQQAIREQS